ncbi:ArsR/SmtB family transcription factor [Halospeciosus flavus]|uniref:ArsR/SmtB family transcription factor n=1 Tax=Halospeciosus flavus TaxID=3032283 RepID=A0ABD5Z3B7_9EURY|nr:winged helix-turn-helix domain-containing protein [Halospeciosus flavus]
MNEESEAPEVFATLDDEYAREILVATKRERLSAGELSEKCDMSRPTVSRRVNRLVEQGFLEAHTHVDPAGHHYKEYEACLERVEILLNADGFDVEVDVQADPADRITSIFQTMREEGD